MTAPSPVRDLLLACTVWDASPAELARVRERAAAVTDWGGMLQRLRLHRLVPHACRALRESAAAIPEDAARELAGETLAIAARALARARQLADLVSRLEDAGVRALSFKGPVLSVAAYGDVAARDSVDLDLVVRRRDLDAARAVLVATGYASRSGMSAAQERVLQHAFGHFSYARDGDAAGVELHWRFAAPRYPWSLNVEDVLARARVVQLAGTPVAVPEAADDALLQALHGARHQWERLEWLAAFGRIVRNPSVDAAMLVARARASGCERALAVALRLTRDLLGEPMVPALAAVAAGETVGARASEIQRAIDRTIVSGTSPVEEPYGLNLRMMERTRDRAAYIALSVVTPTPREWELVRLPGWLLPLYYPIRLARVVVLRGRAALARR